jgi:glycosyltransferase involved in cell wall biosynthesis
MSVKQPLVSVIIPFFNEESCLEDAIQSVLAQDYPNWEIILVDDGSVDNSSAIAKKYANDFPQKIFYYDHEGHANKGLSHSRNHGVSYAKGYFIALLDADDVWLPCKLKQQVQLLDENNEAAMLCEASEYWHAPWDQVDEKNAIVQIGDEQDKIFKPTELLFKVYPLSHGPAPVPSGIIIRKDIVLKHHGFESHFSGKYQLYEDQAFLHKIYLNENVYISSQCNHRYRQRDSSLVKTIIRQGNYMSVRKYFLDWLNAYTVKNGFSNRKIRALLYKAFEPYRFSVKREIKKGVNKAVTLYHQMRGQLNRIKKQI